MTERIDETWRRPGHARFVAALVAVMADNAEIAQAYAQRYEASRVRTREVVERGRRRGELRAGVDPDLVFDALSGVATLRLLFRQVEPVPAAQLVDTVLDGCRPRPRDAGAAWT